MPAEYHQTTRTLDGARLAVQVRGSGPALLLLAGQANNHHWWDRVRGDFHRDFTTITFDYRGTGGSPGTPGGYTTGVFASDALAVIDSLAIDRFSVYGTSMGGRIAQWLAAEAAGRVHRLVLGATTSGGRQAVERGPDIRRALAGPNGSTVLADLMYSPAWRAANPGPYHVLGDPTMSRSDRRKHLSASDNHDAWAILPDITAPTVILHGTDDRFAPAANADILAQRIPTARAHLIDGARHAYFDEFRNPASTLALEHLST